MDRYYNSLSLMRFAKSVGFYCSGTTHASHSGLQPNFIKADKKAAKGTVKFATTKDGILSASIVDTDHCCFASSYFTDTEGMYKYRGEYLDPLPKMRMQQAYNMNMNGVDCFDQVLSHYRTDHLGGYRA